MTDKPHDRFFRLLGISGLILLLALIAWQDKRTGHAKETISPPPATHDHDAPAQDGNTLQSDDLDPISAETTLSGHKEGNIRVVSYEAFQFGFSPDPLVVTAGEHVRLQVKSRDVEHGMMIPEIDFNAPIPVGDATDVEFTAPASPGKYPIFCSVFCGTGHGSMKGTLFVLPKHVEAGHGNDLHE